MLLQEQNALSARDRDKSDKEGKYRSHDRPRSHDRHKSHDRPHHVMTPSKFVKRKHSIPERFSKPRRGSGGSRKTESHKTDSVAVSEDLTGDIEHDSEKVSTVSYHSEPVKAKERVSYYKVYHHPNGGFHVEKGPTAEISVDKPRGQQPSRNGTVKRPFRVPPLDLRGLSTPSRQIKTSSHPQTLYPGYEDKENVGQLQNSNSKLPQFSQSTYPNSNWSIIQIPGSAYGPLPGLTANPYDSQPVQQTSDPYVLQPIQTSNPYGSQPVQTANPGLQTSKSFIDPSQLQRDSLSKYQGKGRIVGYHGIVDPNHYTFYQPVKPDNKDPNHHREEKLKTSKSYKPRINHELPRQQMTRTPVDEEREDPEQNVYNFQQNDTTEKSPEPGEEQPVVITHDGKQVVLPSYTDATQQPLPSNQDRGDVEYTPGGSPLVEESEDDVSLHLADEEPQYDYRKQYSRY